MSNGNLPYERFVNGENNSGSAVAATGAVSIKGVGGNVVNGSGSISAGSVAVTAIASGGGGSNSSTNRCSGGNNNVPAVAVVVTGGAFGGISDLRDVTLLRTYDDTPVISSIETIIPRTCYSTSSIVTGAPIGTTTRAISSGGGGGNVAAATTDCRKFKPAQVKNSAGTTTTTNNNSNSIGKIATAAVVVVDAAPLLFHKVDNSNMVAAMNEHLSNTTTTTTSSATNGARTTTTSALVSSAMTITTTITGANNSSAHSTATVNTTMIGSRNNSNCNNTRNQQFQEVDGDDGKAAAGILSFPCDFDHMYASMTDGGASAAAATSALGVSPLRGNEPRQNDLTEVKHLKELLLLHLDLIQQQSEQIVTKDKLLAALRQENETLKLRLERMERRVSLQKLRSDSNENTIPAEHLGACSPPNVNSGNTPSTSEPVHRNIQSESSNISYNESFKIRLNTSGGITTLKQETHDNQSKHETKQEVNNEVRFEWDEKKKRRLDSTPLLVNTKRKRGISCSSIISSNDTSPTVQDKILNQSVHEVNRKSDKKGKSLMKKESFLTTEEHYYTAVGDPSYALGLKKSNPVETVSSLEVPNWRVKIYTSCYTMEGTENLDDEIFNKRHLKLENNERRRKRWDVQRIREQRHIEKLKQRQERQNHQATCYNTNHTGPCPSSMEEETVTSLWPEIEQIQGLQVDLHLPVTAFGTPVPSFTPNVFSLPWSNATRLKYRRPKCSTGRRKASRR